MGKDWQPNDKPIKMWQKPDMLAHVLIPAIGRKTRSLKSSLTIH